jgi:5'-nucleotidase
LKHWAERCPVDRSKSYYMRQCVNEGFVNDVAIIENSKGFFEDLPPVPNAINAILEMQAMSLNVLICTSPLLHSQNCVQEKMVYHTKYISRIVDTFIKIVVTLP